MVAFEFSCVSVCVCVCVCLSLLVLRILCREKERASYGYMCSRHGGERTLLSGPFTHKRLLVESYFFLKKSRRTKNAALLGPVELSGICSQ